MLNLDQFKEVLKLVFAESAKQQLSILECKHKQLVRQRKSSSTESKSTNSKSTDIIQIKQRIDNLKKKEPENTYEDAL